MTDTTRREVLVRGGAGLAALGLGGRFLLGRQGLGGVDSAQAASGAPIKVGFVHALTGVLSITETSISQGAQLAVQQTNAAGGINGRPIKPIVEDYASDFTVAVQKAGYYRVDAGNKDFREVRVSTADGEARIYSENSGFTLKNGRSAKIFLDGNLAGEWETAAADRYADEFDTWSLERDSVIAKRLKDSYYDKYYDRDIYGADDLSEYGEWVHTRKYGYVWKPYRNSVSQYADWSPYRYGHWRWVPPYGWTWVNDESWGWATYHHGRWIYDNGGWYWTPYGYYRNRRSWWSPALVVVSILNNNVCWYPLPYNYNYYNYNYYYGNHGGYGGPVVVSTS